MSSSGFAHALLSCTIMTACNFWEAQHVAKCVPYQDEVWGSARITRKRYKSDSKASGGWTRKKPTAKGHCANGAGFRAMIKKPSGLRKHNTETERRRNNKHGERRGSKHPTEQREDNAQTNMLRENNKESKQSSGGEYRNQAAAG